MKKFLKTVAMALVLAMAVAMVPAFTVSAADANTVLVGDGQTYATISAAIAGETADGLKGKTIKLTSDIKEAAGNLTVAMTGGGTLTVDGDGHTVTNFKTFITSSTTTDLTVVTIKNIAFEREDASLKNHPVAYARANSHVILEDVVAINGFNYIIGLNDAGNTHATVNSGVYASNGFLFRANYNTCAKTAGSVTINGGSFYFGEGTNTMLSLSGNVAVDINGGTFYSVTAAPIAFDIGKYIADTGSKVSITIDNAKFYYPATDNLFGYNKDVFTAESGKAPMTVTIGSGNVFAPVVDGVAYVENGNFVKTYGLTAATAENFASLAGVTVTPTTALEDAFANAYLANGATLPVNADVLAVLDNDLIDGAVLSFTADTDAAADFANANIVIAKNGKKADNVKSTSGAASFKENFAGSGAYVQAKLVDGKVTLRVIVAIGSTAYSKAGVVYTTGTDLSALKYNSKGNYSDGVKVVEDTKAYTSILAEDKTVEAGRLGGAALVVLNIEGLEVGDTVSFKAYGITSAGAEYTDLCTYTVPVLTPA